jgi:hypothetical protein
MTGDHFVNIRERLFPKRTLSMYDFDDNVLAVLLGDRVWTVRAQEIRQGFWPRLDDEGEATLFIGGPQPVQYAGPGRHVAVLARGCHLQVPQA